MVHLHDCWAEIDAHPGDVVNIITETVDMTGNHAAQYGSMHVLHVSMGKGLLVLHPDILISGGYWVVYVLGGVCVGWVCVGWVCVGWCMMTLDSCRLVFPYTPPHTHHCLFTTQYRHTCLYKF